MKFKVVDNYGGFHESKEYTWDKYKGIPCEEEILEDMEVCNCLLSESSGCEGDCIMFDEGGVLDVISVKDGVKE